MQKFLKHAIELRGEFFHCCIFEGNFTCFTGLVLPLKRASMRSVPKASCKNSFRHRLARYQHRGALFWRTLAG